MRRHKSIHDKHFLEADLLFPRVLLREHPSDKIRLELGSNYVGTSLVFFHYLLKSLLSDCPRAYQQTEILTNGTPITLIFYSKAKICLTKTTGPYSALLALCEI
jgi:hypothetical protein